MPTITELPVATSVDPADEVLVSQSGTARSVSVGSLLAGTQPAVLAPTGALLGRVSLGPGGPEPIAVGLGLALAASTVQATGADHATFAARTALNTADQVVLNSSGKPSLLPISMLRGLFSAGSNVTIDASGVIAATVADSDVASGNAASIAGLGQIGSLASTDLIAVNQGGVDHAITYANLIDGETIDEGTPASAASDTDTLWVGQGGSTMLVQTLAAVWSWIAGHLPGYRQPIVEITTNTTLDGAAHNGRILVVSQPITLMHSATQGSGFACTVINVSSGTVTLDSGITTTSGVQTLASGQSAEIYALIYSAGTLNLAWVSGPTASPVPSQVNGLLIGTVTYNSVALSWSIPVLGGTPTGYVIQYRVTGQTAWTTQSAAVASSILYGLTPGTQYDVEVLAYNAGGFGQSSVIVNSTTGAAPTSPPGSPTGLVASVPTASTVALNWVASTTGGTVGSFTAQYRVTGQSAWITFATGIPVTSITITNLTASTQYDFQVVAVNSAGSSTPSGVANATTTVAPPGTPAALTAGTMTQTTAALSWTAPSGGGAVFTYTLQWRQTGTTSWTQQTGISGINQTVSGLTASTEYDFQVAAVNAGGSSSFTPTVNGSTAAPAPGVPTTLIAGTPTSTSIALSWSAPASGGAAATYAIRMSPTGLNSWSTPSGGGSIAATHFTVPSLTLNTAYDFEVSATNAGGTSAWSSITTASTTNYKLSEGITPSSNTTIAHSTAGQPYNVNICTSSVDGSHTAPQTVNYVFSTSNSVAPTSGWTFLGNGSGSSSNLYSPGVGSTGYGSTFLGNYITVPATTGVWYIWYQEVDASGTPQAVYCSTKTTTTT